MSHVFLQPGHSPQRPDWLAEDAVSCEPVSARNSLLTGKFTGNFAGIVLAACDFRVSLQPIQWFPVEFPIQRNREFSDAYQGKSFEEQRICNPDSKRSFLARLFCACRTRSVLTGLFAK